MDRKTINSLLMAGVLLAIINSISFFTLDQPIGIGGFMGWIPSALVAAFNADYAASNMMFHFFYWETEAAPCVGIGMCVVIGSFLYTLAKRRFKVRLYSPPMWFRGFLGGCLMGFSFPMMRGCNIIHLFAGVPQMALSAFVAIAGMFVGSYLARRLLVW